MDLPDGSVLKNPPTNTGDTGSIPESGRSLREGNGNSLQYSRLEIPWTEEHIYDLTVVNNAAVNKDITLK